MQANQAKQASRMSNENMIASNNGYDRRKKRGSVYGY